MFQQCLHRADVVILAEAAHAEAGLGVLPRQRYGAGSVPTKFAWVKISFTFFEQRQILGFTRHLGGQDMEAALTLTSEAAAPVNLPSAADTEVQAACDLHQHLGALFRPGAGVLRSGQSGLHLGVGRAGQMHRRGSFGCQRHGGPHALPAGVASETQY